MYNISLEPYSVSVKGIITSPLQVRKQAQKDPVASFFLLFKLRYNWPLCNFEGYNMFDTFIYCNMIITS